MHDVVRAVWHIKENVMQTKINWFEIPSSDFARAVRFYETIFDTKLNVEQFDGHSLALFTDTEGGGIGCVLEGTTQKPSDQGTLVYLDATTGLDQVLQRIEAAGGKVVLPKTALPRDMGFIAQFLDTEGNRLALHAVH